MEVEFLTCYVCDSTKEKNLFDTQKYHKNIKNFKCLECVSKYGKKILPVEKIVDGETLKKCGNCKQFKNKNKDFYVAKNTKNGAEKLCKFCKGKKGAKNRKHRYATDGKFKEKIKKYAKERNDKNREYVMWRDAKYRAKSQNLPFNIVIDDVIIPKKCPILDVELDLTKKNRQLSPSLDKINPKLGYVKGNIRVISFKANRLKSDLSELEIENLYNYVKKGRT